MRPLSRTPSAAYRPGVRTRTWWKAKHKLTLPVQVLHCTPELVRWGDWGQACVMAFTCRDPRVGELVTIEQAVRVRAPAEWTPRCRSAEIVCWGVLGSSGIRPSCSGCRE